MEGVVSQLRSTHSPAYSPIAVGRGGECSRPCLVLIVAVHGLCKVDQVDSPCLHLGLVVVCAPRNIRTEMLRVAHNYKRLYEMYNFDYDPEPGSVQYKIDQRIKRVSKGNLAGAGVLVNAKG